MSQRYFLFLVKHIKAVRCAGDAVFPLQLSSTSIHICFKKKITKNNACGARVFANSKNHKKTKNNKISIGNTTKSSVF
jgi:hypothetical protein